MDRGKHFKVKKITKLAVNYHVDIHKEFIAFCNRVLPRKEKYPLLFEILKSTAECYFEKQFNVNNPHYPVIEACNIAYQRSKNYGILYKQLNLFNTTFIYLIKIFIFIILKTKFVKLRFDKCSLVPQKDILPNNYQSSEIIVSFNFYFFSFKYSISESKFLHSLIIKTLVTCMSPISICLLFLLIIPLKINYNNLQKIGKTNNLFLFLIEKCLNLDLLFSGKFLSNFRIKEFITTGWFSAQGSLLFKILEKLKINSSVLAHGHLSNPSLSFFYPVISNSLIVISEEEKIRLTSVNQNLFNQEKQIDFFYKNSNICSHNIESFRFNMKSIKQIIIAFSGGYILSSKRYYVTYEKFILELKRRKYNVYFRPHNQDSNYVKRLQSLDGKLKSFTLPLNTINKKNTLVIGANSTLLLETSIMGILTLQLSDFSTCIAPNIKSVLTLPTEDFLSLIK